MSQDMKEPRGRAATGVRSKDQVKAGSAATVAQTDDIAQRVRHDRARWHLTLGSIRAHLDDQPSRSTRRAAARRWCAAITAMADEEAAA